MARGGFEKRHPVGEWLDRWWPTLVVIATALSMILLHGITFTSGVFYVEFLEEFNQGRGETAWVGSLIAACGYAASPVSSILVNKFGCRVTVIVSGLIMATGLCTSVFAQNVYLLFFTYGVVTGIGCGFIYVPANVIVARYFYKRRTIALGIATGCGGLGSFAFPPLLRYLLDEFGWRGTLLICGGICLNVCVAGAVMRPPSKEDIRRDRKRDPEATDDRNSIEKMDKGKDVLIFKNISYHFICINQTLFCFASSIVYVHISAFGIGKLHISDSQAGSLISVIGIATFVGRLAFGFLAQHPKLQPIYIYTFTFMVAGVATCLVPCMTTFNQLLAYCAIFGLSFAALGGALLPCILIDIAGLDRLSFSYGVVIFYEALGQILGAPCAGFLYDSFHSYDPSFFLGGSMVILSALVMVLPIWNTCTNSIVSLRETILSRISINADGNAKEIIIVESKVTNV